MRRLGVLLVLAWSGMAGATTWEIRFPGFRTMDFPERTYNRLTDLNRVNATFKGAADRLHYELNTRVDTQASSCAYLLGTNTVFRTTRQLLTILSYMERSSEIPPFMVAHFGKLMRVAIHASGPKNDGGLRQVLDEWIAELDAGGEPVHFKIFFGSARRMLSLWEFSEELKRAGHPIWAVRDFYPAP